MSNRDNIISNGSSDFFRILSIDGGGFRGIYAAHILARIEQEYDLDYTSTFN